MDEQKGSKIIGAFYADYLIFIESFLYFFINYQRGECQSLEVIFIRPWSKRAYFKAECRGK